MRSNLANHNLLAVSANNMETALNTIQTLDTSMLISTSDMINLEPRRENNADELTGMEEASTIYDNGALSAVSMNFEKAQPQHYAFLLAFGLGSIATTTAGTGYLHTITPILNDLELNRSDPSFSAAMKYGTVLKKLFYSMFVDSVSITFAEDAFAKISAQIKGTGKYSKNVEEETLSAMDDAVSITLAANGVHGTSAQDRLDSIHAIRAEVTSGVWTDVAFSVVSDATPAVITITAPGSATASISYKVLYVADESGWMTFPSRTSETPLRVTQMTFNMGGAWNGSAFAGGTDISSQIKSLEYSLQKSMQIKFAPGAGGAYASKALRESRDQTLKVNKEMRDYILQNKIDQNETFGCRVLAEGVEFDTGHNYGIEMIFPKVGVLSAPVSADGKRIAEAGDLQILQDDTYGSVIAKVKNKVATYAA